jgi:hypothetical protein
VRDYITDGGKSFAGRLKMKCPKCGAEYGQGAVLCPNCGIQLVGSKPVSSNNKSPFLLIAVVIVVAILVVGGFFAFMLLSPLLQPDDLQIISKNVQQDVHTFSTDAIFTIVIKNQGEEYKSATLVCSVTYGDPPTTWTETTYVSLAPGQTQTYNVVIELPVNAPFWDWTVDTYIGHN